MRLNVSHANMQDFSPRLFPKLENTSHHAKHRKIPKKHRIYTEEDDEKKTRYQVLRTKHVREATKDLPGGSESNEYQQEISRAKVTTAIGRLEAEKNGPYGILTCTNKKKINGKQKYGPPNEGPIVKPSVW